MPIVSETPGLNTPAPNFSQKTVDITDKRALAAQLLALKQQDPNQMVSGRVVAYSPFTAAFDGLSKGFGAYLDAKASEDEKALKQSKADTLRSLINTGQTGADSMAANGLIEPEAYADILARKHEAQPYFTPLATDKGYASFDNRTGKLAEALLGDNSVMKGTDSPTLQGAIASAKEGPQTTEVTLSDGSKVPLTNEQANSGYNYRANTAQPNPQALARALTGNTPPAQSVYDFADPQSAIRDFTASGDMKNAQGVANQYGLGIGQSTAGKVGTEEAIKTNENIREKQAIPDVVKVEPGTMVFDKKTNSFSEPNGIDKIQKPLPTPALKMQQDELDAIGTAGGSAADLQSLRNQIDSNKLELGPINNLYSKGKNYLGISDENSRNYQSFSASLEKLRNDSLRLNRGVQTEGDAQRVWNELIDNPNDKENVKQRLDEIVKINERAALLHKNNLDILRSHYGLEPLDTSVYEQQAPAVGNNDYGSAAQEELKRRGIK
jgi:hypothetical protein